MRFCDSTVSGILRHDTTFQKTFDIGTVEAIAPLTFDVTGDAVVSDSAHVRFTDNTTFRFNGCDSLIVRGILEVGSVAFAGSTACVVPRIVCKNGSRLLLGGNEKTITGLRTVVIDSGATAEILAGSTIEMDSLATIFVGGTLIVHTAAVNPHFKIVCRHGGKVILDESAVLTGLKYMRIEKNGVLEVRNGAVTLMDRGGAIVVNGTMDTRGVRWARFQSMHASVDSFPAFGDYWLGIEFDNPYDTSSVLHNLYIHHGDPGVFTNKTQPRTDSCVFSWNYIGMTVYADSPELRYNRFENNCFAGLNGQFMSTVVTGNRFNGNNKVLNGGAGNGRGAFLYHCGNLWLDDRLDANYIGLDAFEWVDVPFNPWGKCDTVNGTSIRDNCMGAWVQEASNLEFHCDNSVYRNINGGTGMDFYLAANTRVVGWGNYPDSASMSFVADPTATVQWGDPSGQYPPPLSDPVLRKQQNGSRQAPDTNFVREMRLAGALRSLGQYSAAAAKYGTAISFATRRPEAERCLISWQQLFVDAAVNLPNNDALCKDPSSAQHDFADALAALAASADSVWLRNTAREVLAFERMRMKQDDSAIFQFTALAALRGVEPDIARRALTALVILQNTCKHDYGSALDAHDMLAEYFPDSKALSYAKVLLRLPLTEENERSLKPTMHKAPDVEIDRHATIPSVEGIAQPWPNPFSATTLIRYTIETGGEVTLSVFDIQGREIRRLVSSMQSPGNHFVHFEPGETPAGRYLCRLTIRDSESGLLREYSRPMLLVK